MPKQTKNSGIHESFVKYCSIVLSTLKIYLYKYVKSNSEMKKNLVILLQIEVITDKIIIAQHTKVE